MVNRIPVGRVCASRRPSSTMASTGRPEMLATRSGGYSRMRWRNASQPSVWRAMKSRSSAPSASTTFRRPSASAASVPGIGARWVSAALAVRVRTGSITTRWAPAWRAIVMLRQRWWLLVSVLLPHRMMSFEKRSVSGSIPTRLSPSV